VSNDRYVFCLYSDDIRQEINGKISLIGVYQGGMSVFGELPQDLPKLVVSTYINSPIQKPFKRVIVEIILNNRTLETIEMPKDVLNNMQESITQNENFELISVNMVVTLQPFKVNEGGRLNVRVNADNEILESNALIINPVPFQRAQ
jgi:hypothetical protein